MIVTTYTCARCGHAQTTNGQMWTIRVSVSHGTSASNYPSTTRDALWCRKYVEEKALLPSNPPIDPPPELPTIEDLIREIVREELS